MTEEEYTWTEPKPSGIKLRDLYRTFDDEKPKKGKKKSRWTAITGGTGWPSSPFRGARGAGASRASLGRARVQPDVRLARAPSPNPDGPTYDKPCRRAMTVGPAKVKSRPSGIKLRNLYRTFDDEKPKKGKKKSRWTAITGGTSQSAA